MYVIIVINLLTGIFFSSNWFSLDHSLNFSLDHSQKNDQENDQFWSFMRITCSSWWKTCSTWWKICVAPKCSIRTCSNSYMFKFVHTKNVLNHYVYVQVCWSSSCNSCKKFMLMKLMLTKRMLMKIMLTNLMLIN